MRDPRLFLQDILDSWDRVERFIGSISLEDFTDDEKTLSAIREHEPELQKRFGVVKIGIFGSFAHGEGRKDSDEDVLVIFQQGKKTFDNFMGTKFYLEDLFMRKVDLVTDVALKPLIRNSVFRDVVYV
ncbi:nucleotidyltransferase domain-containing protein [uncultured Methanospirillum sp.]|uniref:nucleotidyltransferase domain-containing protein n=1 Tax=uncultured Methanospirillum sp. TaxID=262503 RepID=UPI0029C609F9|nr:nucleotidyltransferase domain-containing protein [uncultured Methanospirillum sp.]